MKECEFKHSRRETNIVADCLAKLAVSMGKTIMLDDLPLVVRELVKCDLTCSDD
jgi:hypothetical protein